MGRDRSRSGREQAAAPRSGQRPRRVAEAIRQELSQMLARGELRDPELAGASITVTEVDVSPDLRHARISVTPLGGQGGEGVVAALGRAAPFLTGQIGRALRLRYAPRLAFVLDRAHDNVLTVDRLLRSPAVARDLPGDGKT